jgi:hypothetical protein
MVPRAAGIDGARRRVLIIFVPNPVGVIGDGADGTGMSFTWGVGIVTGERTKAGLSDGEYGGCGIDIGSVGMGGVSWVTSSSPSGKVEASRPGGRIGVWRIGERCSGGIELESVSGGSGVRSPRPAKSISTA